MIKLDENRNLRDIRVFEAHNLESIQGKGWQLIAIVQETSTVMIPQEVMCPGPPADGTCRHGYYQGSICHQSNSIDVPSEVTTTKLVMGRDKDDVLADTGLRIEELERERDDAVLAREGALKAQCATDTELVKTRECLEESVQLVDKRNEEGRQKNNRIATHLETINRMEADLAKVREHWGSAELDKLLRNGEPG